MNHEHWLDKPQNIQKLWRGFLLVLALTVVAELFIELHPHFEIEHWMGFNAAYGFITCLLMIMGAKLLGLLLKRPDTHYEGDAHHD
ncbi:MAG: hypothetical protein KBF66_06090 [Rhodoferax sp.]|uniref:hypothetical protein n=1 Tax=Rhodoferax sp. TaxID=50421 RepID=UPI001B57DEE4|nr:hypothetical protein [Rhodoferax sp.]MBP9905108.1 hypothetical protein [Rhodoferax sp.]